MFQKTHKINTFESNTSTPYTEHKHFNQLGFKKTHPLLSKSEKVPKFGSKITLPLTETTKVKPVRIKNDTPVGRNPNISTGLYRQLHHLWPKSERNDQFRSKKYTHFGRNPEKVNRFVSKITLPLAENK